MTGSNQVHPTPIASSTTEPTTTEVAKGQASQVAGGAADAAQHVAGVAKEQVGQIAVAAGQQVKHLAGQAQAELSGQASSQQTKLAGGLHSVGDQLKAMAENSDQPGMATDLAHQAAGKVHQVAAWLEDREPADVLAELRSFGRRRPGSFLIAALAAGVVAGRMARGLSADAAGTSTAVAPQKSTAPAPAVGTAGQHVLPSGRPVAEPELHGPATDSDWATPRSGEGGNLK